jgi:imidazolonepropionase-like amidohydrolase
MMLNPAWSQNETLVIEGGTLIDGTGRAPIKDSVVVIEGSRIKAVGTKGNVTYPAQVQVIRADGRTVLPGLIDAHVHFLDFMPELFLHFGVTTVYDTANPTEWILAQRDAQKKGKIKGPRMFVTGLIIDGPPGRGGENPARAGYLVHVQTADEARVAVRKLIQQGVDAIKVYEGLGIDSLKAVVEEAHKAGLEVVGHTRDAREATQVGMRFIEHPAPIVHSTLDPAKVKALEEGRLPNAQSEMDPASFGSLIDLLVRNGVYFNPTLTRGAPESRGWFDVAVKLLEDPSAQFMTEARRESWLTAAKAADATQIPRTTESLLKVRDFIRRFVRAGGKVITGPDSGPRSSVTNLAGLAMHVEMEALVNAGLTPMQAILASTKWSAELLHKEKDLGTVEPGKLADIILIEGDPLADIRATSNIRAVVLDGKLVDTRLNPNFRNPLPRTFYVDIPLEYMGPEISGITPGIARAGDRGVSLQVTGTRFNPRSFIRFDTTDLRTRFVSDSILTATLDDALLKDVGTYAVTVVNPGSGGSPSNATYFIVNFRD